MDLCLELIYFYASFLCGMICKCLKNFTAASTFLYINFMSWIDVFFLLSSVTKPHVTIDGCGSMNMSTSMVDSRNTASISQDIVRQPKL